MKGIYKLYCIKFLTTISLTFWVGNIFAQNLKVLIDKKDILIGEQVTYFINIEKSKGDVIKFSIPDSVPHFDIIEKKSFDTTDNIGKNSLMQKIVFTSFDSGAWAFPAIAFNVNNVKSFTNSFKINVGLMAVDSTGKPRDIKTVLEVDYFNWLWVWLAVAIIFTFVISYLIYRYINNKKTNITSNKKIDAYKNAMYALEKLKKTNEEGSMPVKEYHTKLADVFKDYCGKIAFQNFFNFTTTEVLAKLKTYEINVQTSSEATEALQTGDATKFAKYHPSFTENEAALNFIKNTITEIEKSRTKNI